MTTMSNPYIRGAGADEVDPYAGLPAGERLLAMAQAGQLRYADGRYTETYTGGDEDLTAQIMGLVPGDRNQIDAFIRQNRAGDPPYSPGPIARPVSWGMLVLIGLATWWLLRRQR